MKQIIFSKLSYQIVSCLYESYNQLGYGYQEKHYQRALENLFNKNNLKYKKELSCPIIFNNQKIGIYRLDFLIENKIVIELKVAEYFYKKDILQVLSYLQHNNLILGILVIYTKTGLQYKRILKGNH